MHRSEHSEYACSILKHCTCKYSQHHRKIGALHYGYAVQGCIPVGYAKYLQEIKAFICTKVLHDAPSAQISGSIAAFLQELAFWLCSVQPSGIRVPRKERAQQGATDSMTRFLCCHDSQIFISRIARRALSADIVRNLDLIWAHFPARTPINIVICFVSGREI